MHDHAPPVIVERDGAICRIILNRPDRLNAVTPALFEALGKAVTEASDDDAVRCVILTGAGRAFCAGRDLKEAPAFVAASAGDWLAQRSDYLRRHAGISQRLHDMPKPTIAMINGPCAGAGLSLAGACDLRIAGESAVLTSAFVKAGLSGDLGGTWFWSRILGASRARRLYLMSERYDAAAAERFGLVDQVVADANLARTVLALATSLTQTSTKALRYAKAALNAAEDSQLEAVIEIEAAMMAMAGVDAAFDTGEIVTE